jgi:hypothetical protein
MDAAIFVRALPGRVACLWIVRHRPRRLRGCRSLGTGGPVHPLGDVNEHEIVRDHRSVLATQQPSGTTLEQFAAFAEPGWGRIAADF